MGFSHVSEDPDATNPLRKAVASGCETMVMSENDRAAFGDTTD
jgi:hypothetical protein